MTNFLHPALERVVIRNSVSLILDRLEKPLADISGCTHAGKLVTLVERLGMISTEIQNIAEAEPSMPGATRLYREDLVKQLAELGANALAFIADELKALNADGAGTKSDRLCARCGAWLPEAHKGVICPLFCTRKVLGR
jgi:hypothetical protein